MDGRTRDTGTVDLGLNITRTAEGVDPATRRPRPSHATNQRAAAAAATGTDTPPAATRPTQHTPPYALRNQHRIRISLRTGETRPVHSYRRRRRTA